VVCAVVGLAMIPTGWSALDASRASKNALQLRLGGNYAQAIDSSLHATRADPGRAEYWQGLGLGYVGLQRFGEAATAFERASKIIPYDVRYLGDVARAYAVLVQRGDSTATARARDAAERAVQIDRNNPQAHLTRAVVMQVVGDLPEAQKSVERAMALDTSFTNAQLDLTATQVLNASGRTADAIATARRAIGALNLQDSVQIRVELARALVAAGQPAQALAELGYFSLRLEQWKEAEAMFLRSRALGDTLADATFGLIITNSTLGREPEARRYAEEFLRRWPHDERAATVSAGLRQS